MIIATVFGAGVQAASAAPGLVASGGGITTPAASFTAGRYIVTLVDNAAATYDGGVTGFSATQPGEGEQLDVDAQAVQEYSEFLAGEQQAAADAVGASIDYSYTLALNGFSAELSGDQASALQEQGGVLAVTLDTLHQVDAVPSTTFMGLDGPGGVWESIGGADQAGDGVVVGVLDTGIAPEHPSFAGDPLGTSDGDAPFVSGENVVFHKADGSDFVGVCQIGEQFTASDCSTKIIGARYFVDGFGLGAIGDASEGEYVSPRDGDGHGSHTASTAAGDHQVTASVGGFDYGMISGVAPAAKIAAYKVCWTGNDPTTTDDDGCAGADLLAAIDQAVADGVDVINYSIGGGSATTTVSPEDQAFLGAAAAGIFVAASAGNSGPGASTADHGSPWYTTVAASTIPSYEGTVTLGNGLAIAGASITLHGDVPVAGPLVRGDLVAAAGHDPADSLLCGPDSLDPALATGKIVMCERGVYARTDKSVEVAAAGGIGMILVNRTPGSVDTDLHSVPTVHLDDTHWTELYEYSALPDATASMLEGNSTDYTPPTPQVAGFSSRGPVLADGSDIIKPDIAAPGVSILAAGANAEGAEPTFQFLSGTSMSSPHIAGLAALYLGERPNASPAEIKSAMMTTAYNTVDQNNEAVTDPFAQGAGQVDPTRFFEPGMLYLNGLADWYSYIEGVGYDLGDTVDPIDPSNLNLASIGVGALTGAETITRTVTATEAGTWNAEVSLAGIDAVVEPSTLSFAAAGETASYTVTFNRVDAPLDEFATGWLDWVNYEDASKVVHSPVAVQPVTLLAPESVAGEGTTGSVDVTVTPGGDGDIPLTVDGLAPGIRVANPADPAAEHTGNGTTGDKYAYQVELPAGLALARFDLDAIDNSADLDLVVDLLDGDGGNPVARWVSATGSADEQVNVLAPDAGFYLIKVSIYSGTTDFDVTNFAVAAGLGDGAFAVNPEVLTGVAGQPVTYTASWAGLNPDTAYLGMVSYGGTSLQTLVSVNSGADLTPVNTVAPSISGDPIVGGTLTASPGEWSVDGLDFAFQWLRDGVAIDGAIGTSYAPAASDLGTAISVQVSASAVGVPTAVATSAAVTIQAVATVSLSLNKHLMFSWQKVKATVKVTAPVDVTGTVTVKIGSKTYDVELDANGRGSVQVRGLRGGYYTATATFNGSDNVRPATAKSSWVWVIF